MRQLRQPRGRWRVAGLAAALLLGATACGTSGGSTGGSDAPTDGEAFDGRLEALYEAAKEEGGQLTWYNQFVPDNEARIVAAFNETFPDIELQSLRLTGAEASQRFMAESTAGAVTADVLTQSQAGIAAEALAQGFAVELTEEDIPTLADVPDEYVRGAEVITNIAPWKILYNTDLVEEPPTSWEDLLKPEFKGEILLVDPRTILAVMTQYDAVREELGIEFLQQLGDQDLKYVESAVPGSQSLAAGEGKVLIPSLDSLEKPLLEAGAPVEGALFSPGTGVENGTLLSANAENPAAAKLFIAWLISEDGQVAVNAEFSASPLGDQVPGTIQVGDDFTPPDGARATEHGEEIADALGFND